LYCFESSVLLPALLKINPNNAQGEYYLTDVISVLNSTGIKVQAVQAADASETMGVNSRAQLAEAEKILRKRKLLELMEDGVTIIDPDSVFIDADVAIGTDTVIYPFTMIEGATKIGARCQIGPNTRLQNAVIGDDVTIHFSYGHDCRLEDGANVGPYVHLRPDAHLASGAKIGNFVEIKNSFVGTNSKVPHLSYIGDSDLGAGVNIGSGTITVNYDGQKKHRTVIEDEAFIGCNTNLVAPVTVGKGAYVAAGSTITKNVPPKALGVARSPQKNLEGWVEKTRR
jgi:bifunctional UDP-N-acetylglucosamine pyrophosphorylase/glucosamine-1-phosphate N-acetyltransferase